MDVGDAFILMGAWSLAIKVMLPSVCMVFLLGIAATYGKTRTNVVVLRVLAFISVATCSYCVVWISRNGLFRRWYELDKGLFWLVVGVLVAQLVATVVVAMKSVVLRPDARFKSVYDSSNPYDPPQHH